MGSGPLWTAIIVGVILLALAGLLYLDWSNPPGAGHVRHRDDDHGTRTVEFLVNKHEEEERERTPLLGATESVRRDTSFLVNDFRVPPYVLAENRHLARIPVGAIR